MNAPTLLDPLKEAEPLGKEKPRVNSIPAEEEWSWIPRKNPDIVIHSQPAIAVYENTAGAIVLRQETDWCDDEDTVIWVQPDNLDLLIRALSAFRKV
jgi:hypothetical protein